MCTILEKKIGKAWIGPYLKLFGKGDAVSYFLRSCSYLHSLSYTDEE